jgi:hypothetical protein
MASNADINRAEKRLKELTRTRSCPACKVRVETCQICGARIGPTPADMQATDLKLTDLFNRLRERQGLDPIPHHGLTSYARSS